MNDAGSSGAGGALIHRVLGAAADRIDVRQLAVADADGSVDGDVFEVSVTGDRVVIAGSSALAQATGLRWHVNHPGASSGPSVAAYRHRYHFNFCTFGYKTPFWDWARWEAELDQLAMYGVNLPLAMVGQEAIWQRVLGRPGIGLSDEMVRGFLGGPAYLPWLWMGCLAGWDGPMPQSWIDRHATLGQQITDRIRELGMRPVLPAFAGHVPAELAARARVDDPGSVDEVTWAGFTTHLLRPTSPLFAELTALHLQAQAELLGEADFYAADPFIETVPPVESPDDVAAVAATIHAGMTRHNPAATWVLQSWPFTYQEEYWTAARRSAFLAAVPADRLLLLDLWADHRPVAAELEPAVPWVWSMVNNFGGRPGLYGNLDRMASAPAEAASAPGSRMCGVGAAMEDSSTNQLIWDLLADVGWDGRVDDIDAWLEDWVRRRYAALPADRIDAAVAAWRLLHTAAFRSEHPGPAGSVLMLRPTVDADLVPPPWLLSEAPRSNGDETVPADLLAAWRILAEAVPPAENTSAPAPVTAVSPGSPGLDLADVTCSVLGLAANRSAGLAAEAFRAGDAEAFAGHAGALLETFDDLESVMATREEYLLGRWLAEARRWGGTPAERRYYAADALRLLTLWGPADGSLVDYARRGWSGLIGRFYAVRWQHWVDELTDCLATGRGPDVAGFAAGIRAFEEAFVDAPPTDLPTEPTGDTADAVAGIRTRYLARLGAPPA